MPSTLAVVRRILTQFALDKRTLALLFVAPLVVLWLLSVILGADTVGPKIATVNLPTEFQTQLEQIDARITEADADEASAGLAEALGGLFDDDAALSFSTEDLSMNASNYLPIEDVETAYLHGNEDWRMFDCYGPVFIGIFLCVFTFITSGMSLVTERMGGTMTRFLATPVKAGQILGGYTLAFGLLACLQSTIILWVALTFIGFPNEGNVGLVVFTCITMAMVSVALGLLVSGLATTPFQVIQLILLFVVPQILLCGANLATVGFDLAILWGFLALFFTLAGASFRKKRA